jgi:signal peptidase I
MTRAASLLLFIAFAAAWFFLARPETLGGPAGYILVSGNSMEPGYHTGDLVATRNHSNYEVGDIIAYRVPKGEDGAGKKVIHRIIGGNGVDGYVTQGDNNNFIDPWHPTNSDVIGTEWVFVAGGRQYINTVRSLPAYMAFAVFLVVLGWGATQAAGPRRPRGTAFLTSTAPRRGARV